MLKEILSISGKPGLQKLISNSSNAIIVESLIDGKRFPAYSNSKIIALEDISIYTEAEDMPLKEVFKRISAKENGKSALSHKEPTEKILAYFEEIVPEYDKERVYVSDMKKIIQWYNLLTEKGMLDLDEEAKEEEAKGNHVKAVEGGFRRIVASPHPVAIVEIDAIKALMDADQIVIACGGGGIPVIATNRHHLKGAAAVIDKDFASELLAEHLNADMLIILTAVEKVAINFNKPDQKWLDTMTPDEARAYMAEGQFAPGSMLPKVEAAVKFAESKPGRTALITLLEKARDGIDGKTGTRISL